MAVVVLARNPDRTHEGARILYRDIGDYLTAEEKRGILKDLGLDCRDRRLAGDHTRPGIMTGSISASRGSTRLYPLGSVAGKNGTADETVFRLYSNGYKTGRDAYLYNFSSESCTETARLMIGDYRAALAQLGDNPTPNEAKTAAEQHSANVHWERELLSNLRRRKKVAHSLDRIRQIQYRPFVKLHCYVDDALVQHSAIRRLFFPDADTDNRAICVPGVGSTKPFSALMVDAMPDLELISKGQCFPRYRFEAAPAPQEGGLLEDKPQERRRWTTSRTSPSIGSGHIIATRT